MNVSKEWVIKNASDSASEILSCPCDVKDVLLGLPVHCRRCSFLWKCVEFYNNLCVSAKLWLSVSWSHSDAFSLWANSSALAPCTIPALLHSLCCESAASSGLSFHFLLLDRALS